jgi:hypothetical protein
MGVAGGTARIMTTRASRRRFMSVS